MKTPEWFYDEAAYCGVDYSQEGTAQRYDARHKRFRDYAKETEDTIRLMGLTQDDTVLDFACGTGGFTVHAAPAVKKIIAVDISEQMLNTCRNKCREAGIKNVEFHQDGFLSYQHEGPPVDAVVCQIALHHIPDMWKQIAALNIFNLLHPGGRFLLVDVVFNFDLHNYQAEIQRWTDKHLQQAGPEAITHIKQEYSTMDWIMQGILERAGFEIESTQSRDDFIWAFLCKKPE